MKIPMKNIIIACLSAMVIVLGGALIIILPDATIDHLEVGRLTRENNVLRSENAVMVETVLQIEEALTFTGTASWFGDREHGGVMASGKRFDKFAKIIATKFIPFGGLRWKVVRTDTGAKTVVDSMDDGPNVDGRIADLSYGAAVDLDMIEAGLAPVKIKPYLVEVK